MSDHRQNFKISYWEIWSEEKLICEINTQSHIFNTGACTQTFKTHFLRCIFQYVFELFQVMLVYICVLVPGGQKISILKYVSMCILKLMSFG